MKAYIVSENARLACELATGAAELTGSTDQVTAIVPAAIADDVKGAHTVLTVDVPSDQPIDAMSATAAHAIDAADSAVVLVGATRVGRSLAARIAHALGTAAIVDAKNITIHNDEVTALRSLFGGNVLQTEAATGRVSVLAVPAGSFEPAECPAGAATPLAWIQPVAKVVLKSNKPKEETKKDVFSAKTVVCAGNGVKTAEELALLETMAEKLGGVTSCTRPLTEGEDALFYGEDYIGMTGLKIKPTLYVGVGVSGQVQHATGFEEAKITVGINTDQKASIFNYSDYGIVGDLNEVVPAIIDALE